MGEATILHGWNREVTADNDGIGATQVRTVHRTGGNRDRYLILRAFLPMQEDGGAGEERS